MLKFYIQVFGCQMSKSDAERLAGFLIESGLTPAKNDSEADVLIVNACSVRQSAMDRVHGLLRLWKRKNKKIVTILTGCVLPRDKKAFAEKFDLVLGIGKYGELRQWLGKKFGKRLKNQEIKKSRNQEIKNEYSDYLKVVPHYHSQFSAFVPIMTGCNNFCSYCAVPYVRGRERSRKVKEVLAEIKKLAKDGYLEIILLGQNVNSYNPGDKKFFSQSNPYRHSFAALLWEINQVKGVERIFFTAPHPKDMTQEVIDALTLPKMVNYLHLPLQSGSDKVLKKMNRHYTAKDYLNLVKKIKKKKPGIALGTDIIVGFPGETKSDFAKTAKLYKEADFDISFTARYSPRSGTLAAKIDDDVSSHEKKRRWQVLQKLMESITLKKNQKYLGKTVSVLVDSFQNGQCEGNSSEMKRVTFPGSKKLVGKIVEVEIDKSLTWILKGKLIINN